MENTSSTGSDNLEPRTESTEVFTVDIISEDKPPKRLILERLKRQGLCYSVDKESGDQRNPEKRQQEDQESDLKQIAKKPRIRVREKIYECKECGKVFRKIPNLAVHQRLHTGERPFRCNECGKTFHRNSCLYVHMKIYHEEKPYKCEECGKDFRISQELIQHRRIHTGEKPFKCNECGRMYYRKKSLTAHQKTHKKVDL